VKKGVAEFPAPLPPAPETKEERKGRSSTHKLKEVPTTAHLVGKSLQNFHSKRVQSAERGERNSPVVFCGTYGL